MSATRGEVSRVEHARVRKSVAVVSGRKSLAGVSGRSGTRLGGASGVHRVCRYIGAAKNTPRCMIQIKMSGNDVLNWVILFCTFWEEELIAIVVPAAVGQATLVGTSVDGYRWMLASVTLSGFKRSNFKFQASSKPHVIEPLHRFFLNFDASLQSYNNKTKNNILDHPLASRLQSCDSPNTVLSVLQDLIQQFDHRRSSDERS
jgi:hypothetical protein